MSGRYQTAPPDKPINERKEWVCERCGESPRQMDTRNDLTAFTCACDVTVYPTAPEPNIPASWGRVRV